MAILSRLVLAVDPPSPPTSGARLRVLHLGRSLAAAFGPDDRVVVGAPPGAAPGEPFELRSTGDHRPRVRALFASVRQPYQAAKLNTPAVRSLVEAEPWRTIQVPVFLLPSVVAHAGSVVLDAYDIESETLRSLASADRSAVARARWRWEAKKTSDFERALVPLVAAACATSAADAEVLERLGARRVAVVPNGVDVAAVPYREPQGSTAKMVYVGSYDYRPNVDAATELATEVLPVLRRSHPGASVALVGRASAGVAHLGRLQGVEVVGEVPDVVPHLHAASALVVPIRSGSGTRLKVLEAMAAGTPVVSTSFGIAGIDAAEGREVLVAESAEALAAAAARLLLDRRLAVGISGAARRLVERRYDWSAVARPLVELHERVGR